MAAKNINLISYASRPLILSFIKKIAWMGRLKSAHEPRVEQLLSIIGFTMRSSLLYCVHWVGCRPLLHVYSSQWTKTLISYINISWLPRTGFCLWLWPHSENHIRRVVRRWYANVQKAFLFVVPLWIMLTSSLLWSASHFETARYMSLFVIALPLFCNRLKTILFNQSFVFFQVGITFEKF